MTMRGRAQQFALPVSCRARTDDLGVGPHPAQVLAALADEPGLACLWGNWTAGADVQPTGGRPATDGPLATDGAGATVVMMSGPRAVSRDPAVLDRLPALDGDVPASFVGGGWVGWIGYDAPAQLAFYDHALRFDERSCRWSFEALWSEERAADLEARQRQLRNVLRPEPEPEPEPELEPARTRVPTAARRRGRSASSTGRTGSATCARSSRRSS